jgi:hypothetical protein
MAAFAVNPPGTAGPPTKVSLTVLRDRARRLPADQIHRVLADLEAAGLERDAQVVRDEIQRRNG